MSENNTVISGMDNKTEISRKHFFNEGERIKVEDRNAIYEVRDPKYLAMQVDFGFARYDIILRLIDKFSGNDGKSHLDLGCGLGYIMAKMSQRGYKTSGVDISKSFLDIAEEKLKHWHLPYEKLIEANLEKDINLTQDSFDIITSTDVLEHLQRPDALWKQIHRLLKPQGKAVICTNNSWSIWSLEKFLKEKVFLRHGFHPIDNWFSLPSLKMMAHRQGFKITEVRGTYFMPLGRLKRILSVMGLYRKRLEINELLSTSPLKYFGRDIILVLEKKPSVSIEARRGGSNSHKVLSLASFFRHPFIKVRRYHTLKRISNLLLVRLQLLLRTNKVFGYPTYLVVEPTNICNFRCPLCPTGQGVKGRPKGKMSFANFKEIIDEMGPYLYSLRLENWGEPLLNEEIFSMILYAKTKKITTSFNTNFSFLDENGTKELILSGLDHIKISLDGASEESYVKYRVGGNFNKVIDNIRCLIRMRKQLNKTNPLVEIQFIVMKHNEGEIDRMRQLCSELGVDGLFIEVLRPNMREELFAPDNLCLDKYKEWFPTDSKYSLFDYNNKARKTKSKVCSWLWTSTVINYDGAIVPCCGVYDVCYDFGNFFKEGFKKVWNGPKYVASRRLIGRRKKTDNEALACRRCSQFGIVS